MTKPEEKKWENVEFIKDYTNSIFKRHEAKSKRPGGGVSVPTVEHHYLRFMVNKVMELELELFQHQKETNSTAVSGMLGSLNNLTKKRDRGHV